MPPGSSPPETTGWWAPKRGSSARGGHDTPVGNADVDELSGGNNNDTTNAAGGGNDLINCGLGTDDQVIADAKDGVNGDCERVTER